MSTFLIKGMIKANLQMTRDAQDICSRLSNNGLKYNFGLNWKFHAILEGVVGSESGLYPLELSFSVFGFWKRDELQQNTP